MSNPKEAELYKKIQDLEYELGRLKKKKYGLVWEDKPEKFDEECLNALPVLKDKGDKFKDIVTNPEEDFNILIEGDNYHSLSVLSYSHRGKIDFIYIDPPYNTGNKDFVYNDSFVDKEDSFRHSKWLSFMSKRLRLTKSILSAKGVICISIGEDEVAQLRLLCDSIFGEGNFITQFVWHNNVKGRQMDLHIKNTYENILAYSNINNDLEVNNEVDIVDLSELEHDGISYYKKDYPLHNGTADFHINNRPNLAYSIYYNPNTKKAITIDEKERTKDGLIIGKPTQPELFKKGYVRILPKYNDKYNNQRVWRWGQEKFLNEYKDELIFVEENEGFYVYQKKRYNDNGEFDKKFKNYINIDGGTGKQELLNMFGSKKFDNPKPSSLIRHLVNIFTDENSIILDFFAGSGTTGHSVLQSNKDDSGNRKFILCTNNESKICEEVTYPRIKYAISGYKNKKSEKIDGLSGNLKYLKTDFIKIEKVNDNLRKKMVDRSTEILCLKENTFNLHKDMYLSIKTKIFENKKKYTAILFDTFYFEEFVDELNKLKDKPVSIYVFSHTNTFPREEFDGLNVDFTVEAIPEKILETYKKIFNF